MSVFWRPRGAAPATEARAVEVAPTISINEYASLYGAGVGYADVNASTPAVSSQSIAVGTAMRLLCSLGSELPVRFYTRAGSGGDNPRREIDPPRYMLDPAGDGHGNEDWRYQVLASWIARGNLFGDVLERARAGDGYPTQVLPIDPLAVSGYVEDGEIYWFVNGREVANPDVTFLHSRVEPWPGQVLGRSILEQHADSVGVSLTALKFGRQWFRDGAHPSGMLTNTEVDLTGPDVITEVKARFMAAVYGTREPLVLGRGWQYKPLQVTAEESQFLKTMGWSEAQCARMFGPGIAEALGYETGGTLTYSTAESRARDLLIYSADKWLRRLERLMTSMLPRPQFAEITRDAMLAATTIERFKAHDLALKGAWRTINEVRRLENLPPVAWGDQPYNPPQSGAINGGAGTDDLGGSDA